MMKAGDIVYVLTPSLHNVYEAVVKGIDAEGYMVVRYVKAGIALKISRGAKIYTIKEKAEKEAFIMRLKGG